MRRNSGYKPISLSLHYRNRCKACAERILLTLMCGLITFFVFKGSFITTNSQEIVNSQIMTTVGSTVGASDPLSTQQEELVKRKLRGGDAERAKKDAEKGEGEGSGVGSHNQHQKKSKESTAKWEKIAEEASQLPGSFSLGPKVSDWDEQRKAWRLNNLDDSTDRKSGRDVPTIIDPASASENPNSDQNIMLVTGSAPRACENPAGDHFLLKSIKNKMDYCRLHGIRMFYNLAHISDEMAGYWSKLPLLRELMLAHPEIEWFWWMDSDALITDMNFELPMARYKDHNLVVHGWEESVYVHKSWLGLNTGSFFLRNCQWSLDLLDEWAKMGPKGFVRDEAGKVVSEFLSDRPLFEADDQSALIYMLIKQRKTWGDKIYMESRYCLHGYWVPIVKQFDDMVESMLYQNVHSFNQSNHKVHSNVDSRQEEKWPFVTHFVGCKPCAKDGDGSYPLASCLAEMERAFNFADNQIWQQYNRFHESLTSSKLTHHHVS